MWYSVHIIYRTKIDTDSKNTEDGLIHEFRAILIKANDEKDAKEKGPVIIKQYEICYKNYLNETVRNKLAKIVKIAELGEGIVSGVEIFRKELTTKELYKTFIEK